MKNYVVYFFSVLFLLFVVESKLNVKTVDKNFQGKVSHSLPKTSGAGANNSAKLTASAASTGSSSLIELEEDSFQIADSIEELAVFATVFGLLYSFIFAVQQSANQFYSAFSLLYSVKKFIFIRSIRV
ncbi:hypothetical protein ASG01_12245 [Chryseobacterium sp. Leaf180]|jgi:hypothetical protein|uniref:hypothetical protein n=1 Tax=Chryseobacterium sp. Leaf180 TaxID=1736289 RepID=UPI0006FB93B6|nr:hypothetical protein [Chryseobacterium sp. Leaf180]KQR92660.1 hypothetical protein ASG01_12245 [Chryseobacterium sp. Leaf180]